MIELITENSLLAALLMLTTLSVICALLLEFAKQRMPADENAVADQINAILPQTQCGKCGYPGCLPYAKAIANGTAAINQCPPGGAAGIAALAKLLGVEPLPLNKLHGEEKPATVAFIDEAKCIGCTKCIQACPVDAILGAAKLMHTVIGSECTGCDLCVDPCPVNCIEMVAVDLTITNRGAESSTSGQQQLIATDRNRAAQFKQRFENRNARLAAQQAEKAASRQARTGAAKTPGLASETAKEATLVTELQSREKKSAEDHAALIQAAIARVKAKKAAAASNSQPEQSADANTNPSANVSISADKDQESTSSCNNGNPGK